MQSHFNPHPHHPHPHPHLLQQQLAALLNAAADVTDGGSSAFSAEGSSNSNSISAAGGGKSKNESSRVSALDSLRRSILSLYPLNSLVISHSAPFLCHGLSQLLSDKSYVVRRAAAVAYGCLCAVLASTHLASNGMQSHVLTGGLVERFMAWALPSLIDVGTGNRAAEVAIDSLQEFLSIGEANGIELYVPSILKASQELLEDERTSLTLLHHLLGLLTLISKKFEHCFQPHFVDIVDVLLGWAFMPELSDADKCTIINSFLQFQKQWLSNLHFSMGLLSKFLGDMEILIQDASLEVKQKFTRLLALFSCFSTILQVTASGMLEMNLLEQIREPMESIAPRLFQFVFLFGSKFGWSKWTGEFWGCAVLFAEILQEKFSNFYSMVIKILFQNMKGVSSSQLLGLMKTNMQLLSLQSLALLPSSVQTLLQFDSPLSQLRLHPNHHCVANSAATYFFFLQHGCDGVVSQAVCSLVEELDKLKSMLGEVHSDADKCIGLQVKSDLDDSSNSDLTSCKYYSELELLSFIKFDLKVLLCSVDSAKTGYTASKERATTLSLLILQKLNPFEPPIQESPELQVHVVRTLQKLSEVECLTKLTETSGSPSTVFDGENGSGVEIESEQIAFSIEYLKKYSNCLIRAFDSYSPLGVKLEAINWICAFGKMVATMNNDANFVNSFSESQRDASICSDLLSLILNAAYDREILLRSHVAAVLEVLLQARLINPGNFCFVSVVCLDKLSDPDTSIKNSYVRVLSIILPLTIYTCGFVDDQGYFDKLGAANADTIHHGRWKRQLAIKQSPKKFHSQQLVSVLSYISQRWKVPLSSWIQRLVFSCRGKREISPSLHEVVGDCDDDLVQRDAVTEGDMLEKMCPVSNLAAIWWSIHEAARYCIGLRLRTNLGGPTQTFAAFERMLLDIPNVLLLDTEQSEGKYIGSCNFHLLPMRLLLEFVEALKKNVYNAYEGSCVLPCSPRQSSLFFRANKKVCEEWFSRIREPMMNAGLALHCHDATLHYCALRLQDLRNMSASTFKDKNRGAQEAALRTRLEADVLKVLRHASLALCRRREPAALVGLQKWASMAFPFLFVAENQVSQCVASDARHLSWMTGLVYQAQGQYEKAAAHFSHLLQSEETLSSIGSDGVQFVIARAIESYTSLSDWKSLDIWLTELQSLRAMHAGKTYSGALTAAGNELNAVHALACFDAGDVDAAWSYLDLTPKSSNEITLDPKLALERSEQMLLRSMLQRDGSRDKMMEDLDKAKSMLDEGVSLASLDGLAEAAAYAMQLHCIYALKEGMESDGRDEHNQILGSLQHVLQSPLRRVHQDCGLWMKVFRVYRTVMPFSLVTSFLCEKLLSLARKQENFMLAAHMKKCLTDDLQRRSFSKPVEMLLAKLQYESILLSYAEGKHEESLIDLWSLICPTIQTSTTFASDTVNVVKAKACLKLSTWLKREKSSSILRNVLSKIFNDSNISCEFDSTSTRTELPFSNSSSFSDANWNLILEELVGITTKVSCHLCPTMSKTWLSYSSWCFNQARVSLSLQGNALQSCLLSPILDPEVSPDSFQLTEDEICKVKSIITKLYQNHVPINRDANEEHLDSTSHPKDESFVNSLMHQTVYLMQTASGAPGLESSNGECPSTSLSSQLQVLFLSVDAEMEKNDLMSSVDKLVAVWWSLRQRRVALFGHAAHGYFQYLSHSSSKLNEIPYASFHPDVVKDKATGSTLHAMLYILHILLNYGVELRKTLDCGFSTAPLIPWQEIIPQLFARLSSHPKEAVRKQLEGLLVMLAKLSPWSIVYPLLVDINAYEGKPSEELQRILDCLSRLYPKLIQDVQLVIHGLGAITVLWEEQWLNTLQDLHSDVIRRINMLKEEAARIAENSTLSHTEKNKINAAKYSAMMAPITVALERRLASTSREPQTAHEAWFHKDYVNQLKSAILAFKTPPKSAAALGDVWRPFDTIAASLASYQRKSIIHLNEVAPQLASLSYSDVPMPGLEKQYLISNSSGISDEVQGIITISSFCEQVMILSTKTKPKKLAILGSNGQKYTYLLKGREDLRLDARIMQLLQAVNSSLRSCADTVSRSLAIRYYSVTPISGRAGLIQWVDNVNSMYSVYKSWQVRIQLAQLAAAGANDTNRPVPIPRPSDMFYGKIIPALKEKGIRRVISRRDWPHEVKRKVLLDLMKDTPKQLLWQEMWCASEGFRGFSSMTRRFSGSVAAMSIVGHILGLGDRHLDNILMDFSSGDVVHIDYNVCFDKGKRLKIPEIVPFRLTQTIETALGLTGTEGTFRANCEAVTDILRKNKDIILMLLEVFVWDPLVEWTRGDNHDEAAIGGEEKKGMELAVSLSLFASRFQEIRIPLQEHHDLLVSGLPTAEVALKRFLDVLNQYEIISATFYHVDNERSDLLQLETSAKSVVAEATAVSEKCQANFEVQAHEFGQAKSIAAEQAQEAATWVDQHAIVLDALRSGSILEAQTCTRLSDMEEVSSLTCAVLVSGVPLTIVPEPTQAQCSDLDREVRHLIKELGNGLSCAVETLNEYALALQRVLPLNYITTSPVNSWAQILQLSVSNLSADILSLARGQADDLVAKSEGNILDSVQKRHCDLFHRMETYAKHIQKVEAERSEMMRSVGSGIESKSKEHLLSAFTKYMQSAGYSSKEDDLSISHSGKQRFDAAKDSKVPEDFEMKKTRVLFVLSMAANELYKEVKDKVLDMSNSSAGKIGWTAEDIGLQPDCGNSFHKFEEQIEKCALIAGFVNEVQELIGIYLAIGSVSADNVMQKSEGIWASVFQASLHSCKSLIEQMTEVVLPKIIRSVISYNSDAMEAFGSLSQIRGSIDTALEKLTEVELERASLAELEKTYFVKVGLITEQQLAFEEASMKGRDHLSWEEAEEIATQEEACRTQLDQLHQTWNQKDVRNTSLTKIESTIRNSLISSEQYFSSLINTEKDGELHIRRSTLLSALVQPFSDLELVDKMLPSYISLPSYLNESSFSAADIIASGSSLSESMWASGKLLNNHSFFIWKISILDSILDASIHDISSSIDHNLGYDQLYNALKKKLEFHLQEFVGQYLKKRVAPALIAQLETENGNLQQVLEVGMDFLSDQVKIDTGATRRVKLMLEEYCNAHETARAAKSAISAMERQGNELTEALRKTVLEIVQLEWLHDTSLPHLLESDVLPQNMIENDKFSLQVLNLSRPKLLEKIQSSMSSIGRSLEYLQACEMTSVPVEAQLERAMGWACGGPNTVGQGNSSVKSSGIPSEFHDHLLRRNQFLQTARKQACDIIKICTTVMEFEASRDGLFRMPGDKSSGRAIEDGRSWQQIYLSALTRLDATYHSFTFAEQEWILAQSNMEAAARGLFSATNELYISSVKAKSASGDLQETLATMRDCAYEASLALSAFSQVSKGHTALTSECGSMLEEVMAISEGLPDVYSLGKEAAAAHSSLMEALSKANKFLLPLEASLSTDLAAITAAIPKERENNADVPPLHGQALYKSYCLRLQEACQSLTPLVPSVINSVKELHSMLIKLARSASMHAGNLHKALEGLGESQIVRSQDLALSRSEISGDVLFEDKERRFIGSNGDSTEDTSDADVSSSQDEEWISPPENSFTSSPEFNMTSDEEARFLEVYDWLFDETGDKPCPFGDIPELDDSTVKKSGVELVKDDPHTYDSATSVSSVPCGSKEELSHESIGTKSDHSANVGKEKSDDASLLEIYERLFDENVPSDPSGSKQQLLHEAVGTKSDHSANVGKEKSDDAKILGTANDVSSLKMVKERAHSYDETSALDPVCRNTRGKNAYALSVLRQVELKLEGRDIEHTRSMDIAEQVDYLLKQATSIDNLCNMYEGWTPWI